MPDPSTASAPAPASLTPDQLRALAAIQAAPGHYTAESLAAEHGWDARLTREDVRRLRELGHVLARGDLAACPGAVERVGQRSGDARAVVLVLVEHGPMRLLEVGAVLGMSADLARVRLVPAVRGLVRRGLVWGRRLVAR